MRRPPLVGEIRAIVEEEMLEVKAEILGRAFPERMLPLLQEKHSRMAIGLRLWSFLRVHNGSHLMWMLERVSFLCRRCRESRCRGLDTDDDYVSWVMMRDRAGLHNVIIEVLGSEVASCSAIS